MQGIFGRPKGAAWTNVVKFDTIFESGGKMLASGYYITVIVNGSEPLKTNGCFFPGSSTAKNWTYSRQWYSMQETLTSLQAAQSRFGNAGNSAAVG